MALHLRVINEHRQQAVRESVVFGTGGGSIGRAADNDWVLPDPQRYVSAHHARVHCLDGHYYLEDISTNGVYVNDETEPLAKRGTDSYLLREGDVLRLGGYIISVSLEDTGAGDSAAMPSRIFALHPVGAVQTDIGAVLDLDDLLAANPSGNTFGTGEADLQPLAPMTAPAASGTFQTPPSTARPRRTVPTEETGARRMTRPPARSASRETEAGGVAGHDAALQAFCRGAGLGPEQVPAHFHGLLHLAGQLLREALVGMKDVERAQEQVRVRFGITVPPPEPDAGPSLGQSTVEELLLTLIRQHDEHSLDAVRWLRERHDEVKTREQAVAQAMRAAFLEFIGRLDPAELEARFARAGRGKTDTRHWEQFTVFYRSLLGPADQLPRTFLESFAEAYKDALRPSTIDMPGGTRAVRSSDKSR